MKMPVRIAINGFGRIGRASFKIALEKSDVKVVAINDLTNPRILAHLLKYDSTYGKLDKEIQIEENGKIIKLENKFHFLYFQMKTNKFPELFQILCRSFYPKKLTL